MCSASAPPLKNFKNGFPANAPHGSNSKCVQREDIKEGKICFVFSGECASGCDLPTGVWAAISLLLQDVGGAVAAGAVSLERL